jgi:hypothetical protein
MGTYLICFVLCEILPVIKPLDLFYEFDILTDIRYEFTYLFFLFLLVLLWAFLEDEELGFDGAEGSVICLPLDDFVDFMRLLNRLLQLFFLRVHNHVQNFAVRSYDFLADRAQALDFPLMIFLCPSFHVLKLLSDLKIDALFKLAEEFIVQEAPFWHVDVLDVIFLIIMRLMLILWCVGLRVLSLESLL